MLEWTWRTWVICVKFQQYFHFFSWHFTYAKCSIVLVFDFQGWCNCSHPDQHQTHPTGTTSLYIFVSKFLWKIWSLIVKRGLVSMYSWILHLSSWTPGYQNCSTLEMLTRNKGIIHSHSGRLVGGFTAHIYCTCRNHNKNLNSRLSLHYTGSKDMLDSTGTKEQRLIYTSEKILTHID